MKVYYFPVYARGEAIRMILTKAGVAFENVFVTPDTLGELKESGKLEYGQLPALELDDGTFLSQSSAIVAYLSSKYGFNPETPEGIYAAANLNGLLMEDFMNKYVMTWMPGTIPEDQKLVALETCMTTGMPWLLGHLERKLPEQGWITGDKLTWIDILVGGFFVNNVVNPASKRAEAWAKGWAHAGPKVQAYVARFQEEFKDYLASRPAAPM